MRCVRGQPASSEASQVGAHRSHGVDAHLLVHQEHLQPRADWVLPTAVDGLARQLARDGALCGFRTNFRPFPQCFTLLSEAALAALLPASACPTTLFDSKGCSFVVSAPKVSCFGNQSMPPRTCQEVHLGINNI